jgi:hypothetical protein
MTDAEIDIAFFSTADGPDLTLLGLAGAVGQSSDNLRLRKDVLRVRLAGNCQIEQQPSAGREGRGQKYSAAIDLANATPQHRQIDRIFQRMLLSLHTPR